MWGGTRSSKEVLKTAKETLSGLNPATLTIGVLSAVGSPYILYKETNIFIFGKNENKSA